jgi:hypothetical protein
MGRQRKDDQQGWFISDDQNDHIVGLSLVGTLFVVPMTKSLDVCGLQGLVKDDTTFRQSIVSTCRRLLVSLLG